MAGQRIVLTRSPKPLTTHTIQRLTYFSNADRIRTLLMKPVHTFDKPLHRWRGDSD